MINPYALSIINIALSITLLLVAFIYRYFFSKKGFNLLVLTFIISLLPVWSIFRPGVYESGDLNLHITQSISFFKSLSEGILFPRWAGELNASYGFPAFLFMYSLPYYIISLFHIIGFNFVLSAKIFLALSFVFSGLSMFYWIKNELNEKAGFIAAIFYLFAPYHLVDMHFRSDIGEMLSFTILPLLILSIKKSIEKNKIKYLFTQSLLFAFLIISHPAISIATIPLILIYSIYCLTKIKKSRFRKLLSSLFASLVGIAVSSVFWLPTMLNLKNVYAPQVQNILFPKISDLFISSWRYGLLFQGPKGELSYIVGYTQLIIIVYCLYKLITRQWNFKSNAFNLTFILLLVSYLFMITDLSRPLWHVIPFIKNFQFTYRLLVFIALYTSVLAAIVLSKQNNKILLIIILITIGSTTLNWGNRRVIPQIEDSYIINQLPLSTANGGGLGQATTIWSDIYNPWMTKIPDKHLEILKGEGTVKEISRSTNVHDYVVYLNTDSYLRENTLYYPNWKLYINSNIYPVTYSKIKPKGVIEFELKKGLYEVLLKFEGI